MIKKQKNLLSEADIRMRASRIGDGTAKPEWALELMAEFVEQVDRGAVSGEMLEYLRDAFKAYLTGERLFYAAPEEGRPRPTLVKDLKMEKAFGVVRPFVGRYRIDADDAAAIAADVLAKRVAGASFEKAVADVAMDRHKAKSQIEECWKRAWYTGYIAYRSHRYCSGPEWSPGEIRRLEAIFKGKPGFKSPPAFVKQKPG